MSAHVAATGPSWTVPVNVRPAILPGNIPQRRERIEVRHDTTAPETPVHARAETSERINLELRRHQTSADWDLRSAALFFHDIAVAMTFEFKLEIPVPPLSFPSIRNGFGCFRPGRSPVGLRGEIGLDKRHVQQDPHWHILGTLLHFMLRAWQARHGEPGSRDYYNGELKAKARALGLLIESQGRTRFLPGETPFISLLRKRGVAVPEVLMVSCERRAAKGSKLKLYICPCGVRIRVGRSRFQARCLDCGEIFSLHGEQSASAPNLEQTS